MAATFDKDMNIITNFLKDMDIIAALDDQPNDVGGLTAAELKAKFDEGGKAIQEYINGTLIPEVLGLDGTEASRQQAEAARAEAEAQRAAAETARAGAEAQRTAAESSRIQAEESRIQNESARAAAETARNQAEQQRADETAGIVARATQQADAAAQSATAAAGSASTAQTKAAEAQQSAAGAASSAAAADADAKASQSWAVGGTGTRTGEDTNNARYWSTVAQNAAGGGVTSFHGRSGAVEPAEGDYTAAMVGAVPASEKGAAGGLATLGDDGRVPAAQLPKLSSVRNCRVVVGTSAAGWTTDQCDFLCDGTADNVELQAALESLPDEGGTVVVLEGIYDLQSWLIITKDYVTLEGTGFGTVIQGRYAAGVPLVRMQGNHDTLRHMQMRNGTATTARGVALIEGTYCTVEDVYGEDTAAGVLIEGTGQWATVRHCVLPGLIQSKAPYTRVLYNHIRSNTHTKWSLVDMLNNCYQVVGNYIEENTIYAGGYVGLIADNYVSGPKGEAAISLVGHQLVCRGNFCEFDNSSADYTGHTIELECSDSIVTDNILMLKDVTETSGSNNNVSNNLVIVS